MWPLILACLTFISCNTPSPEQADSIVLEESYESGIPLEGFEDLVGYDGWDIKELEQRIREASGFDIKPELTFFTWSRDIVGPFISDSILKESREIPAERNQAGYSPVYYAIQILGVLNMQGSISAEEGQEILIESYKHTSE